MARCLRWQLDESNTAIHPAQEPLEGDMATGKALTWNLTRLDGSRILWHGGGSFGMSSRMVLFPDAQEGDVLLANDACAGTEDTLRDIAIRVHATFKPK
jgi:serine-type D-Ala-D-Ala carboxypeptidase/endopeptidase